MNNLKLSTIKLKIKQKLKVSFNLLNRCSKLKPNYLCFVFQRKLPFLTLLFSNPIIKFPIV